MDAVPTDSVLLAGRPVRRMGFGAMQLPGPGVFGPPRDHDQALSVLRRAVDAGVNHIDTAQFYGPNVANELIHEALHPYPDDLVLVSKVGAARDEQGQWLPAQRPEELRAAVEANLVSLELDEVPVVNLRRHPDSDVSFVEQLETMMAMRDEGLIGGIGLSNVELADYRLARSRTEVACIQNAFNLADRSGQDLFDACREDRGALCAVLPTRLRLQPGESGAWCRIGRRDSPPAQCHTGPGGAGLALAPGAKRAPHPGNVFAGPPRGEPRCR
jgi:pyridoxine 4-dehydrogenase